MDVDVSSTCAKFLLTLNCGKTENHLACIQFCLQTGFFMYGSNHFSMFHILEPLNHWKRPL